MVRGTMNVQYGPLLLAFEVCYEVLHEEAFSCFCGVYSLMLWNPVSYGWLVCVKCQPQKARDE